MNMAAEYFINQLSPLIIVCDDIYSFMISSG